MKELTQLHSYVLYHKRYKHMSSVCVEVAVVKMLYKKTVTVTKYREGI